MRSVRERIADCIGVRELVNDDGLRIVITPSGTDAELVATSAALSRLFVGLAPSASSSSAVSAEGRKITSIVVAKGEIGRGSASASGGKHFSSLTPSGEKGSPGESLRRFSSELVDVVEISGRDDAGQLQSIDERVAETVNQLLRGDSSEGSSAHQDVVLLHVVMGAKTGFCCPSLDVVARLAKKHPNQLLVVVDACQMRLDRDMYRDFVLRGYLVLLTGSKFFAGAPFCGAVLLPMRCVYEMETAAVEAAHVEQCHPLGMEDYFSQYDFPECMKHVRARMSSSMNVGLLLRWESALTNMEPFAKIPTRWVRRLCSTYMDRCKAMLRSNWSHLVELLDDSSAPLPLSPKGRAPKPVRGRPIDSIISFKVIDTRQGSITSGGDRFLDADTLRGIHMLLAKDLSKALPNDSVAKLRCMLGQPVPLGKDPEAGTVLRIAVGADMMNDLYAQRESSDVAGPFVGEDERIMAKLELILDNWGTLHQQFVEEKVEASPLTAPAPLSDWNFGVKKPDVARVVRQMCRDGMLPSSMTAAATPALEDAPQQWSPPQKLAVVYDLDAIDMAFQSLLTSFPAHFEHRFAMKSCPLSFFVKRAIENDVGVECASIVEVMHALRLGCPPHRVVFDSPCKTEEDIAFALNAGVEVNADSFDELAVIRAHAEALFQSNFPECTPRFAGHLPRIGLRVNPLLGAGSNECLSVSTAHSKFGVPLTPANRTKIIAFFAENPWMQGLHCHVGSQGCTLEMLSRGGMILSELAEQIDTAAGAPRVKVINIGGGLPSNYDSDDIAPTFAKYVDVLRREAPQLFERTGRTILTEFGRSVSAKTGWTVSQVEYIKSHEEVNAMIDSPEASAPEQTGIIHAGSDLFLRTCYRPDLFPHRLSVFT
jgi:diaminopimelate decarboxylase